MRYDEFTGQVLLGDDWRGEDFRGRRVAILATGRDAAPVLPGVAATASSVKVFLDDADWVVPVHLPGFAKPVRRVLARVHLRLAVRDPWMRRLLTPDDRFGPHAARTGRSFYRSLQEPHCKLIRWPVYAVTEHGVRSAEGIEHQVDVIVVPAPERPGRAQPDPTTSPTFEQPVKETA